jgi:hypothetical protein
MAGDSQRTATALHIADAVNAQYDIVYSNLHYATSGEIKWAASADVAIIRAIAAQPADRVSDAGKPCNPFWYHSYIDVT